MSTILSTILSTMNTLVGSVAEVAGAILYHPTEPILVPDMTTDEGFVLQNDEDFTRYPAIGDIEMADDVAPPGNIDAEMADDVAPPGDYATHNSDDDSDFDLEMGEDRPCSPGQDSLLLYEEFFV